MRGSVSEGREEEGGGVLVTLPPIRARGALHKKHSGPHQAAAAKNWRKEARRERESNLGTRVTSPGSPDRLEYLREPSS